LARGEQSRLPHEFLGHSPITRVGVIASP
jgi:hypothetical protein